jgi:tagatose 1,6-diphosphate aldolase GatY/KbaY
MLISLKELLQTAQTSNYAVGAFNVYNLEGIKAVVAAAEAEHSPVILQLHPSVFHFQKGPLFAACLDAAKSSQVPVLVHLDHTTQADDIEWALRYGITSIMADGSQGTLEENIAFTSQMAALVHRRGATIEAELGRLSGSEDGLSVPQYEAHLTDPQIAIDFVERTRVDALAVCIGNVHGHYHGEPQLDFDRLDSIRKLVPVPLVLHGASGLPQAMIQCAIDAGVRKINVNTEVREAYLLALRTNLEDKKNPDLLDLMKHAIQSMQEVVVSKLRLFRSCGRV